MQVSNCTSAELYVCWMVWMLNCTSADCTSADWSCLTIQKAAHCTPRIPFIASSFSVRKRQPNKNPHNSKKIRCWTFPPPGKHRSPCKRPIIPSHKNTRMSLRLHCLSHQSGNQIYITVKVAMLSLPDMYIGLLHISQLQPRYCWGNGACQSARRSDVVGHPAPWCTLLSMQIHDYPWLHKQSDVIKTPLSQLSVRKW